jgi:hypothetical protein
LRGKVSLEFVGIRNTDGGVLAPEEIFCRSNSEYYVSATKPGLVRKGADRLKCGLAHFGPGFRLDARMFIELVQVAKQFSGTDVWHNVKAFRLAVMFPLQRPSSLRFESS